MIWTEISQGYFRATANGWEIKKIMVSAYPKLKYKYVAEKGSEKIIGSYNLIQKLVNDSKQGELF